MRHKHFLAALFMLFFITNHIHAQQKGSVDISLGYGFASSNEIGLAVADFYTSFGTLVVGNIFGNTQGYARINYKNTGPLGFSFKIVPYNKLTIGGYLSYENIDSDLKFFGEVSGSQKFSFYTTALEFDYRYISKEKFQMYFTLGGGTTFWHEKYVSTNPNSDLTDSEFHEPYLNLHVNLLGFRFGKTVGIFTEFGLGYKGLINVGLSFQPKS